MAILASAALAMADSKADLAEARRLSEAGDFRGAEAKFRAILQDPKLKEDPAPIKAELAAVLYNQALLVGRKGNYSPTVPLLKEAIELAPGLVDPRVALALSYDNLGNKPESARIMAEIGVMFMRAGNPKKAAEAFQGAIQRDPRPEYQMGLGDGLLASGDYHGALAAYRKLEGKRFDTAVAVKVARRLGDAYSGLGLSKQAVDSYESASKMDPGPESSIDLAKVYAVRGDWDSVIQKIADAEKKGQKRDADLAFLLSNAHYLKGVGAKDRKADAEAAASFEEAVKAADSGLATEARSDLYQVKGLALLLLGRFDQAVLALEGAVKRPPGSESPKVWAALAAAYDKTGKAAKAAEARTHLPPGP
ncbi:MAG: tetratricopeptide repeat protein [Acidobacteriota bacterium]